MNFDKRLNNIPSNILILIGKVDSLKGQWLGGKNLTPQILDRLKRSVLVTSTGSSTRIEGSKLTDEEVEKKMKGLSIQKFMDRDSQEVRGYYELLKNVFDSWQRLSLSESSIRSFHKELLKYVEKDKRHRGEYKKQENKVHMIDADGKSLGVVFDTTSAYLAPKEMTELVEWTKKALKEEKFHPLLIVGNFVVEFLKIHPFQDGNGRLSRVLTNLLLLKTGYEYAPYISHEKIIEDNKGDYYVALRRSQKTLGSKKENISEWLEFFFKAILEQSEKAVDLLSKENLEVILNTKQMIVWNYLQKIENSATPMEISKKTKIAQPTVRQILGKLMRLKKIKRVGEGRSTGYRVL